MMGQIELTTNINVCMSQSHVRPMEVAGAEAKNIQMKIVTGMRIQGTASRAIHPYGIFELGCILTMIRCVSILWCGCSGSTVCCGVNELPQMYFS